MNLRLNLWQRPRLKQQKRPQFPFAIDAAASLQVAAGSAAGAEQRSLQLQNRKGGKKEMSYYELFQQGPAAYVPVILASLVVTLIAYGAFPLILARTRKKVITKRKYKWLCYGINLLVMFLFFVVINGGPSNGAPYFLWTWVFSASGLETLRKRGVLEGSQSFHHTEASTCRENQAMDPDIPQESGVEAETLPLPEEMPPVRFCRKCGFELIAGSKFCSNCGASVVKE